MDDCESTNSEGTNRTELAVLSLNRTHSRATQFVFVIFVKQNEYTSLLSSPKIQNRIVEVRIGLFNI